MQGIQLQILTQKTQKPTDTNQSENENPIRQYEFEIEKSNKKKLPSMVCDSFSLTLSFSRAKKFRRFCWLKKQNPFDQEA